MCWTEDKVYSGKGPSKVPSKVSSIGAQKIQPQSYKAACNEEKSCLLKAVLGGKGSGSVLQKISSVNFGNETMEESLAPKEKIPHMMIKFCFCRYNT
jgi:hypothetical protein